MGRGRQPRHPQAAAARAASRSADRLATIQPRDGGLALVLHNDTDSEWGASVSVRVLTFAGEERTSTDAVAMVPAGSVGSVGLDAWSDDPAGEFVVAELSTGERAFWSFAEDPELRLSPAPVVASASAVDGGYEVRVRAT